jgi:dienelactone hydrolase
MQATRIKIQIGARVNARLFSAALRIVLGLTLGVAICIGLGINQARAEVKIMPSVMPIPTHTTPPAANPAPVPATLTKPATRPQAEKISFSSAEAAGSKPLMLSAIWVRAAPINAQTTRKPTIVAMHGCGGLYSVVQRDKNLLTPRTASMARELRNAGYNILMPDSLTPRGRSSICTETLQQRDVSTAERARDVQAALRWLSKQDDVDPDRIALLGWAHGGSAVMKALVMPVDHKTPAVKAAIVFYPSCAQFNVRAAYKPNAPLLMLMGEQDDWAPAAPCTALTEKANPDLVKLNVYPDSYHEFDAPGMPLHVRLDVPNPAHPGQGVTSGTNPDTKVLAYRDMFSFLEEQLKQAAK